MERYTILFVDDESLVLSALKRLFRKENLEILTALSAKEGLEILRRQPVQLVVSDQRMPEMNGLEFFLRVKEEFPRVIRIILTGFSEVESILHLINDAGVHQIITKPWNDENLRLAVRSSLERYELQETNTRLVTKIREQNERLASFNEALQEEVERRTAELTFRSRVLLLSQEILDSLPFPVAGIDLKGEVVLLNGRIREHLQSSGSGATAGIPLGLPVAEMFPPRVVELIARVLETRERGTIRDHWNGSGVVRFWCHPLEGDGKPRGVILTSCFFGPDCAVGGES